MPALSLPAALLTLCQGIATGQAPHGIVECPPKNEPPMKEDGGRCFDLGAGTRHQPPAAELARRVAERPTDTRYLFAPQREKLFLIKPVKISAVSGDFATETFVQTPAKSLSIGLHADPTIQVTVPSSPAPL